MKETSNIGVIGVESIRLSGMRIEDLPIAESAIAKPQLPIAYDMERQNKINDILATAPAQSIDYLKAIIKQCRSNIERIIKLKIEVTQKISEYEGGLAMCKHRDKEIAKIEDDFEREEKINKLNKDFLPYNIEAMRTQINQFKETIERCENVIEIENESIKEHAMVIARCEIRDNRLMQLRAKIA